MIHISKLGLLMERKGADKRRIPFTMEFVKQSTGQVVEVKEAVCTSTFSENRSANIMFLPSLEVRKISMLSIIKFNGEEVFV